MSEIISRLKSVVSYSEIKAINAICDAIGEETEAIIISKEIADNAGISRNAMISALKLLEVAGIVKTMCLGMKGTNIKILDRSALEEVIK